jgi:hypothetical protein
MLLEVTLEARPSGSLRPHTLVAYGCWGGGGGHGALIFKHTVCSKMRICGLRVGAGGSRCLDLPAHSLLEDAKTRAISWQPVIHVLCKKRRKEVLLHII